ncbi:MULTISPECIES: hypothetical protein [Stutzerimonas stutzeri subgroup]|nr:MULTISPECIES: hypothetical protein [Stutzerimonas stutzeri subgroup]WOF79488.1 hypothetical protein P5704_003015 [Pseudomonas sp. FeN3W]
MLSRLNSRGERQCLSEAFLDGFEHDVTDIIAAVTSEPGRSFRLVASWQY